MGWLFNRYMTTKKSIIANLTKEWDTRNSADDAIKNSDTYTVSTCLKHCYRGNNFKGVLWSVREIKYYNKANDSLLETRRAILCDLLEYDKNNECWGYKDLDECSGPNYYSCPLSYLNMVAVPDSQYARTWREKVEKYHAEKTLSFKPKIGDKVKLKPGYAFDEVIIVSVKPLRCNAHGSTIYKLPRKAIKCKVS